MSRLINYFRDTAAEMKHVSWPTTRQAVIYTALVIFITSLMAVLVGIFDYLFTGLLNLFI